MGQVLQRAELVLEQVQELRVELAQGLERHPGVALAVDSLVDDTHATGAEPAVDLEPVGSAKVERGPPRHSPNGIAFASLPTDALHDFQRLAV